MTTYVEHLARHVVQGNVLAVEPRLDAWMRRLFFDYLTVAGGGIALDSSVAARRSVLLTASPDSGRSVRVLGTTCFGSAEDAALVAGVTSHGLELDDTHEEGSMHPGVVIFPAILSIGPDEGAIWGTAMRAAIVGYDVMCAVGVLAGADETYGRGFHPTGVSGALGAAAACAVVLGLDEDRTAMALALAANITAGSLEFLSDGSWTKRLNAGNAAAAGIRAARLAAAGFRGPLTAIEGRDGFLVQYARGNAGRELGLAFGRGASETSIKFYPCCRYMHGGIDLLRDIHRDVPNVASRATRVEVGVIQAGATLVANPPERKLVIETPVDAQFSMPFGAAVALASGRADLEQFSMAPAVAVGVADLMARVECVRSDALEAAFPAQWQAEVRVTLDDGSVIERSEIAFRGSPTNPASDEELRNKAGGLVGEEIADRVWEGVFDFSDGDPLDEHDPTEPLLRLVAADGSGRGRESSGDSRRP